MPSGLHRPLMTQRGSPEPFGATQRPPPEAIPAAFSWRTGSLRSTVTLGRSEILYHGGLFWSSSVIALIAVLVVYLGSLAFVRLHNRAHMLWSRHVS